LTCAHTMDVSDSFTTGVCFGHQIISRALGGDVGKNPGGWEVGPTIVKTTPIGRLVYGVDKIVSTIIPVLAAALN
jgi:GMP synthase-like glutamine amidotransferase